MTFTEAALEILKREGKPLHFKELTERAMTKKLLTFVGRTPEVTMQTQLTAAVKKAPGNPFVRVKPGIFGLLRYPELPPEELDRPQANGQDGKKESTSSATEGGRQERAEKRSSEGGEAERGRRRRRGGRTRGAGAAAGAAKESGAARSGSGTTTRAERAAAAGEASGRSQMGGPGGLETGGLQEGTDQTGEEGDEPAAGGLSAEARAAALAETGVLEGDDETSTDDDQDEDGSSERNEPRAPIAAASDGAGARSDARGNEGEADDEFGDEEAFGSVESSEEAKPGEAGDDPARRRRRRRRRRRGAGEGEISGTEGQVPREVDAGTDLAAAPALAPQASGDGGAEAGGAPAADGVASTESSSAAGQSARRIMAPVDAAIEILRGQPPGRGVHVRQIADSAIRRRLIHGEPNEAWRVIRTSLAAEPKDRLRHGMRPRVRAAGSGLYALARRTPDTDLEKAEQVFGEARRALRERTVAALERRISELPAGAFEALARVLLQREGFGPTTFVKRVEGTIYVEALRGRGSRPSKCLIGLRPAGSAAGRRAIGELRAGIRARGQDEGLLMLAGRLAEDAISEWKQPGPPLEIADGEALAETCARHGVGVLPAVVNVDFVDADFFAELAEG